MALEFTLAEFFHPLPLAQRWLSFRRSQYFAPDALARLQDELLRRVVRQAATQVPYYRDLFRTLKLAPDDIRTQADLAVLPPLTKALIHEQGARLHADDRARWHAKPVTTSGTSGRKLSLLMDTPANVLEFNYYLRFWAWRGYRLGHPFAELSTVFFQKTEARRAQPLSWSGTQRRLLLNSVELSADKVRIQAEAMRARHVRFLKGLPSVLYHFAQFVQRLGLGGFGLKAVFSQGELLQPQQRRLIEEVFGCKVADSYGHMERTIAISECEEGRLHAVSDYGLLQLEPVPGASGGRTRRLFGTGLYNMSMPLLRYDVGDLVTVPESGAACPCGRHFPQIETLVGPAMRVSIEVMGRREDLVAPSGKVSA
jgi:phenylacetate-CoA ligase